MKKILVLVMGMIFLASCATTLPPKTGSWEIMLRN